MRHTSMNSTPEKPSHIGKIRNHSQAGPRPIGPMVALAHRIPFRCWSQNRVLTNAVKTKNNPNMTRATIAICVDCVWARNPVISKFMRAG